MDESGRDARNSVRSPDRRARATCTRITSAGTHNLRTPIDPAPAAAVRARAMQTLVNVIKFNL